MREHHDLGAVRSEMSLFSRDMKSRVRRAAGERFHCYQSNVSGRLSGALPERMEGWKGNLAKTTREFQGWLAATLEEGLTGIPAAEGGQRAGSLFKTRP